MKTKQPRKPYFNPYVLKQVLEDVYLSPMVKELLKKEGKSYKQDFLFPNIRDRFMPEANKIIEGIEDTVIHETLIQLFYEYEVYVNPSERDKQRWYDELREQFDLPSDYNFE
ncbi:hypothetical protein [Bacillus halotolerans]|uniref:hypothetical protein n=1 Tax=Bacillus halotolerans TaxID=260554 RepID=UPI0003A254AA|nr:hypothetical protein [Bacillus halotolerans]